ncbi:MAG TPA: ABC transporter permease [Candidatus Sumerlaeota bacterium]|nr:ABC transporter permease [Candidatus Sumerlaeota bacterium]
MNRLLATLHKDFLLLHRDRAALALLFLMPLALVIVISLVQDSTLRLLEGAATEILIVNHDSPELGRILTGALTTTGLFKVSEAPQTLSDEEARTLIAQGHPKVCLILPQGATRALIEKAFKRYLAHSNIQYTLSSSSGSDSNDPNSPNLNLPELCFYSKMLPPLRRGIQGTLAQILNEMETQILLNVLTRTSGLQKSGQEIALSFDLFLKALDASSTSSRVLLNPWTSQQGPSPSFRVNYTPGNGPSRHPNASQQNIPAWSVFAMFFVVVPLSASLIRERQIGTFNRLRTLPGSFLPILLGKLLAYLGLCLLQFGLILLAGLYLLPALGVAPADFVFRPFALLAATLSVALAATSLGLLIGSSASTHEQASVFGAVSVVIASALGGVMVPVFAMPEGLARLSVISPLNWALKALFHALTADPNGSSSLLIPVGELLLFAVVCIVTAWGLRSRLRT